MSLIQSIVPPNQKFILVADFDLPDQVKKYLAGKLISIPAKGRPTLAESGVLDRIALANESFNRIYLIDVKGFGWMFTYLPERKKWVHFSTNNLDRKEFDRTPKETVAD